MMHRYTAALAFVLFFVWTGTASSQVPEGIVRVFGNVCQSEHGWDHPSFPCSEVSPLAGREVRITWSWHTGTYSTTVVTDDTGHFIHDMVRPDPYYVTVKAEVLAPCYGSMEDAFNTSQWAYGYQIHLGACDVQYLPLIAKGTMNER